MQNFNHVFDNNISILPLLADISNNISIPLTSYDLSNNILNLTFFSSLTNSQAYDLYNIFTTRTTIKPYGKNNKLYSLNSDIVTDSDYIVVSSIVYPGRQTMSTITHMGVYSYLNNNTEYNIRIYDIVNNKIIADGTFNNTDSSINYLSNIGNLVDEPSIWEVQARVVSGELNVKSLIIFYD